MIVGPSRVRGAVSWRPPKGCMALSDRFVIHTVATATVSSLGSLPLSRNPRRFLQTTQSSGHRVQCRPRKRAGTEATAAVAVSTHAGRGVPVRRGCVVTTPRADRTKSVPGSARVRPCGRTGAVAVAQIHRRGPDRIAARKGPAVGSLSTRRPPTLAKISHLPHASP